MNGEGTELWRRKLQDAVEWIDANPVDPHGSDENFKRYVVICLIKTFAGGPSDDDGLIPGTDFPEECPF
jgi:hypothetical protein